MTSGLKTSKKDIRKTGEELVKDARAVVTKRERGLRRLLKKKDVESNIFTAFILNLFFSIFEFIGGAISGSIAIMTDAVHDLGDAISIGFTYFLEKKSKKGPDKTYTYGYSRFSVLGGFVTTLILVVGAVLMIALAVIRLFEPVEVKTGWMIAMAVVGVLVNGIAAFRTRSHKFDVARSINERAVNLHMLEDVFTWLIVLVGALMISLTGWVWLDAALTICVGVYLIGSSFDNFRDVLNLFLEKVPEGTSVDVVKYQVLAIPHVKAVHHIHLWSMDERKMLATMHVVVDGTVVDGVLTENSVATPQNIKNEIRKQLKTSGIDHVTIELETEFEDCGNKKD